MGLTPLRDPPSASVKSDAFTILTQGVWVAGAYTIVARALLPGTYRVGVQMPRDLMGDPEIAALVRLYYSEDAGLTWTLLVGATFDGGSTHDALGNTLVSVCWSGLFTIQVASVLVKGTILTTKDWATSAVLTVETL